MIRKKKAILFWLSLALIVIISELFVKTMAGETIFNILAFYTLASGVRHMIEGGRGGDLDRLGSGAVLVVMAVSSQPISGFALIGSICTLFVPLPGLGRRSYCH